MKVLVVLIALQTAVLVVLVSKIIGLERAETSTPADTPFATLTAQPHAHPVVSEGRLRTIVREELAMWSARESRDALAAEAAGEGTVAQPGTPDRRTADGRGAVDPHTQLQRARDRLEYFKSRGHVSHTEMQAYQEELARLEPAVRTQMLRNLVRAMNAGQIKGEL